MDVGAAAAEAAFEDGAIALREEWLLGIFASGVTAAVDPEDKTSALSAQFREKCPLKISKFINSYLLLYDKEMNFISR